MNRIESAASYHERGYGCAQSVLASFAEDYGLSEELALKACHRVWFRDGQDVPCLRSAHWWFHGPWFEVR